MLRVTIELIPHGKGEPETIAVATIANIGKNDDGTYDYFVSGLEKEEVTIGLVKNYERFSEPALKFVGRSLGTLDVDL